MKQYAIIIFCIVFTYTAFLSELSAQNKSIGSTFSYSGIGLVYEHSIEDGSFVELQLRVETASLFSSRRNNPGASASFTWNMIFAEKESHNGNMISFFAGPGAIIGIAPDINSRMGIMFGLKGRVGCECTFARDICISFGISPVLGVHIGRYDGMTNMLLFKNGLLYTIMPEIGIKYAF